MQPFKKMIWYLNVLLQAGKLQEKYIYMLGGPSKWSTRMWPISNDLPDLQMSSIDHIWQYIFLTLKVLFVLIMFYSIHFMEHENSVTAPEIFCFCKIYIRKLHLYRACNAFRNYRYWYHTKIHTKVWLIFCN